MRVIVIFLLSTIVSTIYSQKLEFNSIPQHNLLIIADSSMIYIVNYVDELCKLEYQEIMKKKEQRDLAIYKKIEEEQKKNEILKEKRNHDICFQREKVDGIKIRIGARKTLEKAKKLKREAMILFPYISTPEIKDFRPNYYVMIGDYFSIAAAKKHFIQVRKKYPNSVLTNWRVYCRKAIHYGK